MILDIIFIVLNVVYTYILLQPIFTDSGTVINQYGEPEKKFYPRTPLERLGYLDYYIMIMLFFMLVSMILAFLNLKFKSKTFSIITYIVFGISTLLFIVGMLIASQQHATY